MMGLPVTEDLYSIFSKEKEHEEKEKESQRGAQEQVSLLLQTYMQLLLPDDEKFHGGWALINCDMRSVEAPARFAPGMLEAPFIKHSYLFYNPAAAAGGGTTSTNATVLLREPYHQ